jgi:hypothetical protein
MGPALILPLPAGGGREIIPHRLWFVFGECGARRERGGATPQFVL